MPIIFVSTDKFCKFVRLTIAHGMVRGKKIIYGRKETDRDTYDEAVLRREGGAS